MTLQAMIDAASAQLCMKKGEKEGERNEQTNEERERERGGSKDLSACLMLVEEE